MISSEILKHLQSDSWKYLDGVDRCQLIASYAHEGQTRKGTGQPYIVHPQRVASKFTDPTLRCVGWLHDVIEDTSVTADDLRKMGIDDGIIATVQVLSRKPNENYLDFIKRISWNEMAVAVKLADLEDNMSDLKEGTLKDKYRLATHILQTRKPIQ